MDQALLETYALQVVCVWFSTDFMPYKEFQNIYS